MSPARPPTDRAIVAKLADVLRLDLEAPDGELDRTGRARFVERVAREARARPRREPRAVFVVLAAALITVVVLSFALFLPKHTVEYTIDGARAASGGFVQAPPDGAATIHFSDGSEVTLSSGSRGRVNEVRERGARFTVETGVADVAVAKREGGADYVVEAGPYAVKVTGTRFSIGWDPTGERMRLALSEGSVVITGPQAEAGIGLRAGQTIELDPAGVRVSEPSASTVDRTALGVDPASTGGPTSPTRASADAPSAEPTGKEELAPERRPSPSLTWSERVATGDYESVLSEVDARGVDATLAGASAGELMSLADAARYGRRPGLASDALTRVRARFPGTRSASTAAFLLGRMAEDGGRSGAAISLYDATLSEGGAFASEALGRKMMIVKRQSGDGAARPIAEQYLQSFPRGPYAEAAQALVSR